MAKITLYGTEWCPFCLRAEQLLRRKGVAELNKVDVGRDPALREAMMARTGRRTVPQIFIGETHVGGFDELSALDRDGRLAALLVP